MSHQQQGRKIARRKKRGWSADERTARAGVARIEAASRFYSMARRQWVINRPAD